MVHVLGGESPALVATLPYPSPDQDISFDVPSGGSFSISYVQYSGAGKCTLYLYKMELTRGKH